MTYAQNLRLFLIKSSFDIEGFLGSAAGGRAAGLSGAGAERCDGAPSGGRVNDNSHPYIANKTRLCLRGILPPSSS